MRKVTKTETDVEALVTRKGCLEKCLRGPPHSRPGLEYLDMYRGPGWRWVMEDTDTGGLALGVGQGISISFFLRELGKMLIIR